jgi:isoleucyl-tRNA synthetase
VDGVKIECQNCRTKIARIPDVGNPWLDAGVVAMSTLQYDDDRKFWGKWFPADLISESFPGQFRNWFYSLLAMSTILERRAPFKHVFTYATLLAEDGREMHKSAGNSIEFNEAADKMGVDVMRWMYCDHKPEKDLLFGYGRADLVRKQFLIPLWNVYSFFVTYANIDNWEPDTNANYKLRQLDRWILSRLAEVMHAVTRRLDRYEPDMATSVVNRFIDDLSNWYLRRSRRRFWASKGASKQSDQDKQAAYHTLYTVLVTLGDLLAPFVPFVTETIYQNLVRQVDPEAAESVHHRQWPEPQKGWLDEKLNQEMELVKRLVSLGHAARNQANRKLRQPLSEAAMAVGTASDREIVEQYQALISEELNVKTVRLLDTAAEAVDYQLKPLPKQLGQKYGSQFPPLREAILALDPLSTAERLLAGETIEVAVGKEEFTILPEEVEVLIEAHEGFSAAADGAYVAALDVELTDALINEGLAREFVRRVQDLRRQADLKVDDRIIVEYQATPKLAEAITAHTIYIEAETLADSLSLSEKPSGQASAKHQFDSQSLEVALSEI